MSNLLDVTGDDIAQLSDADLRTLVGMLCEADYRSGGLSTRGIRWGGHQDARDGGLDVVVRDSVTPPQNSFIPRKSTGFQVKKPDMPPAEVFNEMRPKGVLREAIKSLIAENGAYIVVSSSGSTTETALKGRVDAMREAVSDQPNHENLHLDFFDRGRIATWVRSYPSLMVWVRNKAGRTLSGWRPYENWANTPGGTQEEYLFDNELRLHDGTKAGDEGLSAEAGLLKLRSILSGSASVRLTGLSGVGKTRLVQALFDARVGGNALNSNEAVYTDVAVDPAPDPITLATQLVNDKRRAILIIDNCPPALHNRLTQICSGSESTLGLLTVEYDVRDDVPENTTVFRLEPASEDIIEKLIRKRFSHISQVDARKIAEFSGGNARVAISLANTVKGGETLARLRSEELFERLFRQRNDCNDNLLRSAEALSLVYSFEGTDATSENSELQFLGSLIDLSGPDLYRHIAELQERDLIQSRSVWRAVLPQAIANRLAQRALISIPREKLVGKFMSASERLIVSFSRRLSFLHDSEIAVDIVTNWLKRDGWIGRSVHNLSDFGINVFRNIAPVAPEKTLEAIEQAAKDSEGAAFTSRKNRNSGEFVRLLRHLAYDPALFGRSVRLLIRYALSEDRAENNNSTREALKSLFYLYLSGTHAPLEARAMIIESLVNSVNEREQELGLALLDATLETWRFGSHADFDFGARPRDFGYEPKTSDELKDWFTTFFKIFARLAISGPLLKQARRMLADKFRGLWTNARLFDLLENSVRQIRAQGPWNEGWIAVRETLRYDGKRFNAKLKERLLELEKLLKPDNLLEQARTFALSEHHRIIVLDDNFDSREDAGSAWRRAHETTRELGAQVAQRVDVFQALLPDLVAGRGSRLTTFGRGLADGSNNKAEMFEMLRAEFKKMPADKRNLDVILGFLASSAESDPSFHDSTLDSLLTDDVLGEWFPVFQTRSVVDKRALERLHRALDLGTAKIEAFQHLAYGRAHESVNDEDLADLLKKILSKEDAARVVMEIFQMRFGGHAEDKRLKSPRLLSVGRDLLLAHNFDARPMRQEDDDRELSELAYLVLPGEDGVSTAEQLIQQLAKAIKHQRLYTFDYPRLLKALASVQPSVFLDIFMETVATDERSRRFCGDPLNEISDDDLISWSRKDPVARYPLLVSTIHPFRGSGEPIKLVWKPVVYAAFEDAVDLDAILDDLWEGIWPRSWSGSLADIMVTRGVLFEQLFEHENWKVRAWAKEQHRRLQESIQNQREIEREQNRKRNARFESFES